MMVFAVNRTNFYGMGKQHLMSDAHFSEELVMQFFIFSNPNGLHILKFKKICGCHSYHS